MTLFQKFTTTLALALASMFATDPALADRRDRHRDRDRAIAAAAIIGTAAVIASANDDRRYDRRRYDGRRYHDRRYGYRHHRGHRHHWRHRYARDCFYDRWGRLRYCD